MENLILITQNRKCIIAEKHDGYIKYKEVLNCKIKDDKNKSSFFVFHKKITDWTSQFSNIIIEEDRFVCDEVSSRIEKTDYEDYRYTFFFRNNLDRTEKIDEQFKNFLLKAAPFYEQDSPIKEVVNFTQENVYYTNGFNLIEMNKPLTEKLKGYHASLLQVYRREFKTLGNYYIDEEYLYLEKNGNQYIFKPMKPLENIFFKDFVEIFSLKIPSEDIQKMLKETPDSGNASKNIIAEFRPDKTIVTDIQISPKNRKKIEALENEPVYTEDEKSHKKKKIQELSYLNNTFTFDTDDFILFPFSIPTRVLKLFIGNDKTSLVKIYAGGTGEHIAIIIEINNTYLKLITKKE